MGLDEIFAGRRMYGVVDEHDGECVETEFLCIGLLRIPIVPERSFWVVGDRNGRQIGFQIKLDWRSVAAAYLRIWAPGIAAVALVLSSSPLAIAFAAALFGLSAWSWTWWPRDAAARRYGDFDLAVFGSRCDPARMLDGMQQLLADQLSVRAGGVAGSRPPSDIVRSGAQSVDEAVFAYGLLRLADVQSPGRARSPYRLGEEEIGGAARRPPRRGGPYRERHAANALDFWTTLSTAARASAGERRAWALRTYGAISSPGLILPGFARTPWVWVVVLAVSTAVSGVALYEDSMLHRTRQERLGVPRLRSGDELERRPIGEYVTVQCDYVQNSDQGQLRDVTLCLLGRRILAVAGGNRRRDSGQLLQGRVATVPAGWRPSWASALRQQIREDPRYYDFYLRRLPYGDDSDVADDEANPSGDDRESPPHEGRGEAPWHIDDAALIRALVLAITLATLAGWFVWIRLWQHRRRVATWIVTS